jgi:hypothetical protein
LYSSKPSIENIYYKIFSETFFSGILKNSQCFKIAVKLEGETLFQELQIFKNYARLLIKMILFSVSFPVVSKIAKVKVEGIG